MSLSPPPVRFLAPGAYPGPRGTPLAIRWLAEAWRERGHDAEVWTADASERSLLTCPGRPDVPVRRLSNLKLSTRSGPSVRRALAVLELARALRSEDTRDVLVHAHGPDAAWLCWTLGLDRWVAHRHTSMAEEMPSYWPAVLPLVRATGHVLDHAISKAPQTFSFHAEADAVQIAPVVPVYEIKHVSSFRRAPLEHPTLVYLGNADRYQDLESLFHTRWSDHLRRRWVVNHEPPSAIRERAEAAGFEVLVPMSLAETLEATAGAWWGVCPRRIAVGYPYKILTYAMLGLTVLSTRKWPGAIATQLVTDWERPELELACPPERASPEAVRDGSKRTLDLLERSYCEFS